jgi:hypothetical protein
MKRIGGGEAFILLPPPMLRVPTEEDYEWPGRPTGPSGWHEIQRLYDALEIPAASTSVTAAVLNEREDQPRVNVMRSSTPFQRAQRRLRGKLEQQRSRAGKPFH